MRRERGGGTKREGTQRENSQEIITNDSELCQNKKNKKKPSLTLGVSVSISNNSYLSVQNT